MNEIENNGQLKITTGNKIRGLLQAIKEEEPLMNELRTYNITRMFHYKGIDQPKKTIICSAIKNAGYNVVFSYLNPHIIRTDAPYEIIHEIKEDYSNYKKNELYTGKSKFEFNEDIIKMRNRYPKRFHLNPSKSWGPKPAAAIKYSESKFRNTSGAQFASRTTFFNKLVDIWKIIRKR